MRTAKISEVAHVTDFVASGSFASIKANVTYRSEKSYAILIRTTDYNNGWNGDYVWVDEHSFSFLSKSNLRPKDVIVSNVGSIGIVFQTPDLGVPMSLAPNAIMCRSLDPEILDQDFIYYYLKGPIGQHLIHSITSGSAQPKFNKTDFRNLEIKIPEIERQRHIGVILKSLDNKIELNRKMNETLEQMARALFKSWFIDFDPVHAKAAGRQPAGMDKATADLFPDSFVDSELGKTPMGWKVMTVGEAVECLGGATPSTAETKYWEGGIHHWTTPKDFSSLASPFLLDTERKLTDAGIAKISSGLLPAGTLLLSSRAPIGYIAIATIPVAINQGFIALKCNENASNFFMLNWCKANMAEIESRATGTTFPEISKLNFRPIRVCLPPKELMSVFTSKVSPMYGKVVANLRQSRNLSAIRDTLLPRLLNGDISTSTTS